MFPLDEGGHRVHHGGCHARGTPKGRDDAAQDYFARWRGHHQPDACAHEIAGLLGETTAESKVSLLKLIDMVEGNDALLL